MDKEKEIEEMAKAMCKGCSMIECKPDEHCYVYPPAERAVNAGYGNIKQAVKEFAEKFCDLLWIKCGIYKTYSKKLAQEVETVIYGD